MRVRFAISGGPVKDENEGEIELPEGSTVAELLRELAITWGEVGIVVINGSLSGEDEPLRDGDVVELIAPIGGG